MATTIESRPDPREVIMLQKRILDRATELLATNMPDINTLLAHAAADEARAFLSGRYNNITVTRADDEIVIRIKTHA